MNICVDCGAEIYPPAKRCAICRERFIRFALDRAFELFPEEEAELRRDIYYSRVCETCGKEGAYRYSDGHVMCSYCHQEWLG